MTVQSWIKSQVTVLALASLACVLCAPAVAMAAEPNSSQPDPQGSNTNDNERIEDLSDQVDGLSIKLDGVEKFVEVMLVPIGVLVTILAAGGVLGVVYSVRDQRRAGQLHELTVGGEIASQRRSEQSYGSFFEQSQTTLSLVNDTLQLAKEANDRAMQSMESKAQARIDEIEERSQTLLLDVFTQEEFELIINDPRRRDELHDIAAELRSLEGYLSLQDIELPQYTKFIKALDQFLLDDTEAAIHALRLASQEGAVGDLQRFVEYWLGYMLTTVGDYDEAIRKFRHDKLELKEDDAEYFQLERIIAETEFFLAAQTNAQSETSNKKGRVATPPPTRFDQVAELLDHLAGLGERLEASSNQHAKHHTRLEIARTRADIYEWVAYDPNHLDEPLDPKKVRKANKILNRYPETKRVISAVEFMSSDAWNEIQAPDTFRTWALKQARKICEAPDDRNLDVEFALAECLFKLGKKKAADSAFSNAERTLHHEFGELHEKRRSASIHQSVLICHSRLLKLREEDPSQKSELIRRVQDASRDTVEVLKDMRQGRVTIFSQIQRRNITREEFGDEVREIVKQNGTPEKRG